VPWKIRPSKDVLATSSGTRRRSFDVDGTRHTLEFGKEPVYLDFLPEEISLDPHLQVKEVTAEEMASAGGVLSRLKAERVQDAEAEPSVSESVSVPPKRKR
jgi:hypothetical protein